MSHAPEIYELVRPMEITPFPGMDDVWIGDDTVQSNGSFKIRGALHALQQTRRYNPELLENGVFCPSAGNAGQGAALAATHLGLHSHIFMPRNAPSNKVAAVEQFGGTVTLVEGTVDNAMDEAYAACNTKGGFFLHPFDDAAVINGQATIGYEIALSDHDFDSVFVPVGGGGLLAGVCQAFDECDVPTKVFGVQLEGCDAFSQSVTAGQQIKLAEINSLADGTAVKKAGALTLKIATQSPHFGGMITVSKTQLGCALSELDMFSDVIAETAAGLSLAGLKTCRSTANAPREKSLAVITGKHRDQRRYQQLLAA